MPLLFIHLVGIGKPVRQVPDQRPQHRIGIAKLALHGRGIDDIDYGGGGRHGSRRAFALPHDRGHFAKEFTLTKRRQKQTLARADLDLAAMDQLKLVAFFTGFEDDIALLEGLAHHIHDNFHRAFSCPATGWTYQHAGKLYPGPYRNLSFGTHHLVPITWCPFFGQYARYVKTGLQSPVAIATCGPGRQATGTMSASMRKLCDFFDPITLESVSHDFVRQIYRAGSVPPAGA